jgi:predicted RecB family endonuclease
MERDIIERLREMSGPIVPNLVTEAADAIERLRARVDQLEADASALTERQSDIVARLRSWAKGADEQGVEEIFDGLNFAAAQIERLQAERDEARRYVCNLVSWDDQAENFAGTPHEYARQKGWDCFKEDGK